MRSCKKFGWNGSTCCIVYRKDIPPKPEDAGFVDTDMDSGIQDEKNICD